MIACLLVTLIVCCPTMHLDATGNKEYKEKQLSAKYHSSDDQSFEWPSWKKSAACLGGTLAACGVVYGACCHYLGKRPIILNISFGSSFKQGIQFLGSRLNVQQFKEYSGFMIMGGSLLIFTGILALYRQQNTFGNGSNNKTPQN